MTDNTTLAKRIAELERQVSNYKDLYESSMLSEATAKQYAEELDKQNKELAAQVETLRMTAILVHFEWANNVVTFNTMQRLYSVVNSTPQQHLAEIRAEAGRVGYLQGIADYQQAEAEYKSFWIDAEANQYADGIRQGKVK